MKTNFSDAEGEFCALSIAIKWSELQKKPEIMSSEAIKAGANLGEEAIDVYNSAAIISTLGAGVSAALGYKIRTDDPLAISKKLIVKLTAAVNNHLKENKYADADDLYEKSQHYIS